MHIKTLFYLLVSMFLIPAVFAQSDPFPGVWELDIPNTDQPEIHIYAELKIGTPERNHLYPAQISFSHAEFSGTYSLLLIKKNKNQLSIGRNKIPASESPFSIGAWTVLLNGYLNLQQKNNSKQLSVQRFPSKKYGVPMPALANFVDSLQTTAYRIHRFLRYTEIDFKKISDIPWMDDIQQEILHPYLSGTYYGIMDSIHVSESAGILRISDKIKKDRDSISVMLNNHILMDAWPVSNHSPVNIKLDTGMNILSFFAENYGSIPPSTAKLNVQIGKENFDINFANKADISSTFIVTKLYYYPIKPPQVSELQQDNILYRTIKTTDSIYTNDAEITLAIWDDAVQDGDSISLFVNGQWLVQQMAVTKQPKFLNVKLHAGPNDIVFVADNLGAISPNTSILEIIDKKRRKSFNINTNLRENSLVRIIYVPEQ